MIPYAVIMDKQIPRLEAFFKRLVVDKDNNNGDDNSSGEYWEFIRPDDVLSWSLELLPMTANTYFVHKFKNSPTFLPISYEERLKGISLQRRWESRHLLQNNGGRAIPLHYLCRLRQSPIPATTFPA
jgi:hypothetical protein